jgi:NADPH-dependent glutamate synthase beta subunit-like oxidoreductase/NAD(P)H-flavin reductase
MTLPLAFGLRFADLYRRDGLARVDAAFLDYLRSAEGALADRLGTARAEPRALAPKQESELLVALAPHVEDFIAALFGIQRELAVLAQQHHELAPVFTARRNFVQRIALQKIKAHEAATLDGAALGEKLTAILGIATADPGFDLAFAHQVIAWQADANLHAEEIEVAIGYASWATQAPAGKQRHHGSVLFKAPRKLDVMHLVPVVTDRSRGFASHTLDEHHLRRRDGFALTDPGTDLAGALGEAHYCIWCHEQGKDSCSRGLTEKQSKEGPALTGSARFKKSPFGVTLAGCPLEEKISEFHLVKTRGQPVGALAMITVDNAMVAATGHRICNDCMKSCIYQKQDPVNIPQAETRTVKDVLELPFGFEIYSLLTRWNPLNLGRPLPKAASGKRVLISGMGPAGFTLAHHLMNDGHSVVGIDGLKIEPLPGPISGVDAHGKRVEFEPIRDINTLYESLDDRVMAGFGGVAEYGITARWDKNYLKVIRLLLERRAQFALFGGVRFGGTITADEAFTPREAGGLGFDHIALCMGAGRPTVLDMPNGLARGVRTASDFLMALQLTGAARKDSIANMQLRLPAVVIGGGLTGVDAATESLAYYPVQVEKFLGRYEILVREKSEEAVRARFTQEEIEIADEFIYHAQELREERALARHEGRAPDFIPLLKRWGGVTIAYRKRLVDSPSYTLNHEEIELGMQEGIIFAERLAPKRVEVDQYGHARSIRMTVMEHDEAGVWTSGPDVELPARTILVAAGTQPNTVLAREDAENFVLDGRYFQAVDGDGNVVKPARALSKPDEVNVLLSKREDGRFISFFGDLHPSFFGNVVKAMGGAKQGYPVVSDVLSRVKPAAAGSEVDFLDHLSRELRATVQEVKRLTPTIVEVVIKAPRAARKFEPGQFYRLQNFETLALRIEEKAAQGAARVTAEGAIRSTTLAMEGLALTGAWVDKAQGLLSTIVLEMGGSSDLCAFLKPGEPVVLMGPTGAPTEIPDNETVVLVGGGLGNAVLFSIGAAMRKAGSKVLYFAGYKKMVDRYKTEEIEAAADAVVWCSDEAPGFRAERPQDKAFVGNIVQAMYAYASGALGDQPIPYRDCDRIIAIGSDRMMAAVALERHDLLKPYLKPHHFAIGSINSPMQCMMKEICAQCLQPQIDPATGETSYVFSCFNQDQPLDRVDFSALDARLRQNSLQEKLTAQWIRRCLEQLRPTHTCV